VKRIPISGWFWFEVQLPTPSGVAGDGDFLGRIVANRPGAF
jgi:hypothetical protein